MSIDYDNCTDQFLLDNLTGKDNTIETIECEERFCRNCDNHCNFYCWDDIKHELEYRGYIDIGKTYDKYVSIQSLLPWFYWDYS